MHVDIHTYRIQCPLGRSLSSSPCISHVHVLLYSDKTQRPPKENTQHVY